MNEGNYSSKSNHIYECMTLHSSGPGTEYVKTKMTDFSPMSFK